MRIHESGRKWRGHEYDRILSDSDLRQILVIEAVQDSPHSHFGYNFDDDYRKISRSCYNMHWHCHHDFGSAVIEKNIEIFGVLTQANIAWTYGVRSRGYVSSLHEYRKLSVPFGNTPLDLTIFVQILRFVASMRETQLGFH